MFIILVLCALPATENILFLLLNFDYYQILKICLFSETCLLVEIAWEVENMLCMFNSWHCVASLTMSGHNSVVPKHLWVWPLFSKCFLLIMFFKFVLIFIVGKCKFYFIYFHLLFVLCLFFLRVIWPLYNSKITSGTNSYSKIKSITEN